MNHQTRSKGEEFRNETYRIANQPNAVRWRRVLIGVAMIFETGGIMLGCSGRSQTPGVTSPTPAPPPSPNPAPIGQYSITGVVADEGGRPVQAANVDACCVAGQSYSNSHGALLTDETGHYRMTGIPATAGLWFRVSKSQYVQQCAAPPVTVGGDMAVDFALVSRANLTATAQSAPGFRSVSGTVVKTTSAGNQLVAGAIVAFSRFEDFEPAFTYSDQAGRFALCGLPADETVQINAGLVNYGGYTNVPSGQATGIEITLKCVTSGCTS